MKNERQKFPKDNFQGEVDVDIILPADFTVLFRTNSANSARGFLLKWQCASWLGGHKLKLNQSYKKIFRFSKIYKN